MFFIYFFIRKKCFVFCPALKLKKVGKYENVSWYYNKSINVGDTSDIIANVENVFVCLDKILEELVTLLLTLKMFLSV